jgi:hypothetical protein
MRKCLLGWLCLAATLLAASAANAAPGSVRCGKLLDVRGGRMLTDQVVVFDDSGTITAWGRRHPLSWKAAPRPSI